MRLPVACRRDGLRRIRDEAMQASLCSIATLRKLRSISMQPVAG